MTEAEPASAAEGPGVTASERSLRRRLSAAIVAGLACAALSAHGLEAGLAYELEPGRPLRHGNYGLGLAQVPRAASPRVVLLGNSVYQACGVVERMQALAGDRLELINLAQLGSGVADHVVQAVKAVEAEPDLLVLCVGDLTFSSCLPPFRTTADQLVFDPGYTARLPGSFYRRHVGVGEALTGLATSAAPFARSDPLLRHAWAESAAGRPAWLYDLLRFPSLNLTGDLWDASGRGVEVDYPLYPPYAWSQAAFAEALDVAAGVPLLVIWQESAPVEWVPSLLGQLTVDVEARGGRLVDLRAAYDPARFRDIVHPADDELDAYAARHLGAIRAALPAAD